MDPWAPAAALADQVEVVLEEAPAAGRAAVPAAVVPVLVAVAARPVGTPGCPTPESNPSPLAHRS